MALTQSVIKIYDDALKTTLLKTVTTSGSATTIDIADLTAGTAYFATVTATADGLTSDESPVYKFYTLCGVRWTSLPTPTSNSITGSMEAITTDVGAYVFGMRISTHSDLSDYTDYTGHATVTARDLDEHTDYYVAPLVIDEFGRKWVDESLKVYVTTNYDLPVINWTGMMAIGITDFTASVNVQSNGPITSVVAYYTQTGGSTQTQTLTAGTGTQSFRITGLQPNTEYTVTVRATNAAGYADTTTQIIRTNSAAGGITVKLTSAVVSNSNNIITVESEAAADASCTITGHYVDMFMTADIARNPVEEVSGGANDQIRVNLGHADPDTTYFLYGKVTYTIGSDPTEYTAWSEPLKVDTYSLLAFTSIVPTDTQVEVRYAVSGTADSIDIQYSADGTNWHPMTQGVIRSGVVGYGLAPNTVYQLRGRCRSNAGWSDWITDSFITAAGTTASITVDSVTNVTQTSANVNLIISES